MAHSDDLLTRFFFFFQRTFVFLRPLLAVSTLLPTVAADARILAARYFSSFLRKVSVSGILLTRFLVAVNLVDIS